jgi:hypothetical protein
MDGCLYKRKVIYQRRRLRAGDERMDGWMDGWMYGLKDGSLCEDWIGFSCVLLNLA